MNSSDTNRIRTPRRAGWLAGLLAAGLALAAPAARAQTMPALAPAPAPAVAVSGTTAASAALDLVWSMRSGLNVAALLCRNADLTRDYNSFIKRHAGLLAAAYAAQEQRFRRDFAAAWQTELDGGLTRQSNNYILNTDRGSLCAWATALAADVVNRSSDELAGLAADAIAAITPAGPILVVARGR